MHFIINLDKPKGISSQQAVTAVRKITRVKKAGHAGTLDPAATGVLLVCTGEATKITRFLTDLGKEYTALMKLGEKTDTLDSEGQVIMKTENFSLDRSTAEEAVKKFRGSILQTPPMYSALKVGGRALYSLAREGLVIERPARPVNIYSLEITKFAPPFMEIRVSCSKGTYIRSLCDDIGSELGIGAHIAELRRTGTGNFKIENAATLEELEELMRHAEAGKLISPAISGIDAALAHLSEITLSDREYAKALNGAPFTHNALSGLSRHIRLRSPSGELFAIGTSGDSVIRTERLLHLNSVKAVF